jgi:cardiolipin synthase
VHWVSLSYAEQVQARGLKVMLYTSGFMHQKAILVDDCLAAVGTMNLDNRALYLNFETMVLVHGQAFNTAVDQMLIKDFLSCRYLQPETRRFRRTWKKLRANTARLFAPLL